MNDDDVRRPATRVRERTHAHTRLESICICASVHLCVQYVVQYVLCVRTRTTASLCSLLRALRRPASCVLRATIHFLLPVPQVPTKVMKYEEEKRAN